MELGLLWVHKVYLELTQFFPDTCRGQNEKTTSIETPTENCLDRAIFPDLSWPKGDITMNASSFTQFVRKFFQILSILAVLAMVFAPVPVVHAQSGSYPLTGELGNPSAPAYNTVWEPNGRLWQPMLPEKALRREFTVSFRIVPGTYTFNGTEAELRLDESRNGKGLDNPMTVGYGNDLTFTVKTADGQPAWAIVYGRGNASGGFDIWATSPTYSGVNSGQPELNPVNPVNPNYNPGNMPNLPSNWVFWLTLLGILTTLLCGGIVSLGILIGATIAAWKHGPAFGLIVLFVGGALMFFLPVIGHIVVIVTWIAAATTKPVPAQ